jgi:hypothetical protein
MKVVLTERDGSGGTWIDDAPDDASSLRLTEVVEYEATGETRHERSYSSKVERIDP